MNEIEKENLGIVVGSRAHISDEAVGKESHF